MSMLTGGHVYAESTNFCDCVRSNGEVVSVFINVGVSGGTPPSILGGGIFLVLKWHVISLVMFYFCF